MSTSGVRAGAAWAVLAAAALGACRCDEPGSTLTRSPAGFRVSTGELDFGKALEGAFVVRTLTVSSTAPYTQQLRVVVSPPFRVAEAALALEPAATVELAVTFAATPGDHASSLLLASDDASARVILKGRGVRPLACLPSAPCRTAAFDLDAEACLEAVAQDGALCDPSDVCEVDGVCQAGSCRGQPRSCDDNNPCTLDGACLRGFGCLHQPRTCPGSSNPCQVAACDPRSGCMLVPAPGRPCGPFESCAKVHLCSAQATCVEQPAPDGFPCSAPTPCREGGVCQAQQCVEPDAGTLAPTLVLALEAEVRGDAGEPVLFASEGNLFAILCAAGADGGSRCALRGWTGNLLQLFDTPFEDARRRTLAAVDPDGMWLLREDGVERRSRSGGTPRFEAALGGAPTLHGQAVATTGAWLGLVATDGGQLSDGGAAPLPWSLVRVAPDAGVELHALVDDWTGAELALTADDVPWAVTPGGTTAWFERGDAGAYEPRLAGVFDAGTPLVVGAGHALIGGRTVLALDGGAEVGTLNALINGEPAHVVPEPMLLTRDGAFVLLRSCAPRATGDCPPGEQSLWIRRFDPATATPHWTTPVVLAPGDEGYVVELLSLDGGVGLVTQRFDAGVGTVWLEGFRDGEALLSCPIEGEAVVGGVVFEEAWMYALLRRDGGWSLEGYDLTGAPVDGSGWSARHGVSGTRRARR